jgi:phosphohistidine phosphatase SixA
MTTQLYLIRHAEAGHREQWGAPDELRPLTTPGRRQAEALVTLFADQPFSRLVSSPYVRCVQTLEPLAQSRDLRIETADELAEGCSVSRTTELMLAVSSDGPAALSTHGDIVENVLDDLQRRGAAIDGPFELEKGSTWIIDVSDGGFKQARYVPPPA